MRTHLQSSRHRVTMLAQQLRASGSMHANQQGICVSEVPEGLVTRVSKAASPRLSQAARLQIRVAFPRIWSNQSLWQRSLSLLVSNISHGACSYPISYLSVTT
jgi:hypothetical protein